jgi:prepilin-type N-terminal cleavage/methylation domain-containing protein
MKVHSLTQNVARSRGITLIEILMVVSLLAILVSFAVPSVGGAVARAELTATVENVEFSIQSARNIARINEAGVALNIEVLPHDAGQRLTISSPEQTAPADVRQLQTYHPPGGIRFIPDHDSFIFDKYGMVKNPGRILLVSTENESITATLRVE